MTWGELIRRLKRGGFVEYRRASGSHVVYRHPETGIRVTVAIHTKQEVGKGLAHRILRNAGVE